MGTYNASLHQRFRAEQYFNCMICFGRNFICIHKIFYIIQQLYKEELCARFWVKGFKVKVDQDKSSLYLKRARSLVLTNSWPQEAGNMIPMAMLKSGQHRPYHWEQPFLHFTHAESRPFGHLFKRIRSLDIYLQSTDFNISN